MNSLNSFTILAIIIGILIILSLIKKLAKVLILILIVFMGFSVFKAIQAGKTPSDIFNASKNDPLYVKQIYNYTPKIKNSVEHSIISLDKSLSDFKKENKNLHSYYNYLNKLSHGVEFNSFHQKYCSQLHEIVAASDSILNGINSSQNVFKNTEKVKHILTEKLNDILKYEDMLKN